MWKLLAVGSRVAGTDCWGKLGGSGDECVVFSWGHTRRAGDQTNDHPSIARNVDQSKHDVDFLPHFVGAKPLRPAYRAARRVHSESSIQPDQVVGRLLD